MLRHGTSIPSTNPIAMAMKPTAITSPEFGAGTTAATNPVSGPVDAVSVWACVHDSFQITVLRSIVTRAPEPDVTLSATISPTLLPQTQAISSGVMLSI